MNIDQVIAALSSERGRPLGQKELEAVVRDVAARPELWEEHIDPAAMERTYVPLHRDDHVDVWAIFWLPDNDTGFHDHDISSGAVRVVQGALQEAVLRVGGPPATRRYEAGQTLTFGPSHIHRVSCPGGQAVSIHAYSPPLWRLGQYSVDDRGILLRVSLSYADELRPLDSNQVVALGAA